MKRAHPALCSSCHTTPEQQGAMVRCASESCFLRSLIGWSPIEAWDELMADVSTKLSDDKQPN